MIRIDSVSLQYGQGESALQVLQDITFTIAKGRSCAIIGPSGCGKTSLLFLLAGLRKPSGGKVLLDGEYRSGTILQNYGLFPWKTVRKNIALGLTLKKTDKQQVEQRVSRLLDDMELTGFGDHFPSQLSGGMQQRVALARALAVDPDILYMDEPLSSLDALTRERLQNLILDIWQKNLLTPVLVTHSIEEAVFLGQQILIMSKNPGRIVHTVENNQAGDPDYRQQDVFFKLCNRVRNILREEDNG
jgi:ABC-type nitrate/sulfonate/bicarbonate transport system ATPase subunit